MKNSKFKIIIFTVLLFSVFHFSFSAISQVRPIYDYGAAGLGQKLKRLQTTASAMHTGAHPDDEDSGLMAYLARREQARTVYLSLNRGDGGQNVIGEELFVPLGVIRTEELLQARRLDGGEQMFTRTMDYGFSKSREEAARIWGEELTLGDMVRAIRLFRPMVVISRFSGTPADGHGHHQLAGYLSPIAFKAAADPNRFPEHFKEGLRPWQAKKFYVGQGFRPSPGNEPTLILNTGEYDSIIGRSYFEIAMEGRSQHKSQEMGVLELRGRQTSGLRLVENLAGKAEKESGVFDGIDTSIKGIAALTGETNAEFAAKLAELQTAAESALKDYEIFAPSKLVPVLAKGLRLSREAESLTINEDAKFLLRQKQREFADALQTASGAVVDALADTETIVAGNSTNVAVRVFAPANAEVKVENVRLKTPNDWTANAAPEPIQQENPFRPRREDALDAAFFTLTAPKAETPTKPYWTGKINPNFTFDWTNAGAAKNMPFQKPIVTAEVTLNIGGEQITVEREVEYRFADQIRGEIRRKLNVVPTATVGLESNLLIAPVSSKPQKHRIVMTVTNHSPSEIKGAGKIVVPNSDWTLSPASRDFALKQKADKTALEFELIVQANTKTGTYALKAQAEIGGQIYDLQMQEIAYPHIQTHRLYSTAFITAQVLDLQIAPVKIGYITGSGDKVPQAIQRLGLDVSMLDEKELSTGDLNKYDTIVVGIRASQTRPDYVANNGRLTEFMNKGGTLIVQYQQQEFVRYNLPPFPAKMNSNIRTTDENAPVKILAPAHPVFNFPNKITDADFAGWVQERNLYTLTEWSEQYTPLLETHDAGEPESKGGLLFAKVGKGNFVYNSYSFFRQLPTGNPGAYRIFANLLSLPKAK
jgi:LmbE family N-acetylglucosaminyl deacetylase